jgi:hypothetical protein
MRPRGCSTNPCKIEQHLRGDERMTESIGEIQRLLQEIIAHLSSGTKTDARKAVAKLERVAALASTAALTIQVQR